jgi:hypothetical protein
VVPILYTAAALCCGVIKLPNVLVGFVFIGIDGSPPGAGVPYDARDALGGGNPLDDGENPALLGIGITFVAVGAAPPDGADGAPPEGGDIGSAKAN